MAESNEKVRVLVVDDSAVMRKLIQGVLDKDPDIEVVATAIDGDFAVTKVEQLKPDVVTMDIDMPRMDGITALGKILAKQSTPVVMLSCLTARGAELTMKALEAGAVDFICKPKAMNQVAEMSEELISKVKSAARNRRFETEGKAIRPLLEKTERSIPRGKNNRDGLLAIGASSGGPHALRYLLPRIPADFGAGIVIVQHMPESFTKMLARWLDEICEIEVREACDGDFVRPGCALIAPGDAHMKVRRCPLGAEVVLERGSLVNGHMPSVDVLFRSVAREFGPRATALIMTGMGSDGAEAMGEIKDSGGHTIAQDEESCAIFGMPRVAINKGYIDKVVPLTEIASYLETVLGRLRNLEVAGNAQLQ